MVDERERKNVCWLVEKRKKGPVSMGISGWLEKEGGWIREVR